MDAWNWYYLVGENWVATSWQELQVLAKEGAILPDTMVTWNGLNYPFQYRHINAKYFYIFRENVFPVYSEEELHTAADENRITPSSIIWGAILPHDGVPYNSLQIINIKFDPDIKNFLGMRSNNDVTVLSGPNNSGKSLILKLLRRDMGSSATFLSVNRYYHIDLLGATSYNENYYRQRYQQFITQLYRQKQNLENNDLNLPELITQMKTRQRQVLWQICTEMLGEEFRLQRTDPENELSQYFIAINGNSLAVASSGTRLLLMIVAACLDENCNICLIDEPELGLSPRLQFTLAKYLMDQKLRQKYFPHLAQVFLATHSHLFLDRAHLTNNFAVTKDNTQVTMTQMKSPSAFHNLQFSMLGNDLEALFLPSAIIIVEGPTDYSYVRRILQLYLPANRISIVLSEGEGDTKRRLNTIKDSFGDLMKSPYRDRIFILLDKVRSVRVHDFTKHGIPSENVIILQKNGIEYYYPHDILADVFACVGDPYNQIQIGDNQVSANGITKTKKQLCDEILARITVDSPLSEEFQTKVIDVIKKLVG